MAKQTRRRGSKGVARRLLSPVKQTYGLLANVGNGALTAGKDVLRAGVKFANKIVNSTGRRVTTAARNLAGRRKTRRNRNSRKQRR
jgi:hypothetical protein